MGFVFSEVQTTGDEAGYRNALEQALSQPSLSSHSLISQISPLTPLYLPISPKYLPNISHTSPPYLEQTMGTHAFNELALTIDSLFFIAIFFDVALYCVVRGVFSTAKDGRAFLSRAPGLGWRL